MSLSIEPVLCPGRTLQTLAPDSTVSECDVEDDDIIDVHW